MTMKFENFELQSCSKSFKELFEIMKLHKFKDRSFWPIEISNDVAHTTL